MMIFLKCVVPAGVCVDLEVTGGVDEQIGGLQVAVQHVG